MILHKLLVLSDLHCPFEDKEAVGKIIDEVIPREKPDIIIINGDLVDWKVISRFAFDPRKAPTIQDEINSGRRILERIHKRAPKARKIMKAGNHEDRWHTFLNTKARELLSLDGMNLEDVFQCRKNKFEFYETEQRIELPGDLVVVHGWSVAAGAAKANLLSTPFHSGISGHTHKAEKFWFHNRFWVQTGHLCLPEATEYMGDKFHNAQLGFGFGVYTSDGNWDINPVVIDNHTKKFYLNGKLY